MPVEHVALQRWESEGGAVPSRSAIPRLGFTHRSAVADGAARVDEHGARYAADPSPF
ncbi:hypothetical protein ACGFK1_03355 [Mycobacterium sp. NPDC048908]|uniref:hypothetical protein n=1 Tax=Mycobacterium sp. NPDC048908 TaxID=3364292 RepID=UPI003722A3C9